MVKNAMKDIYLLLCNFFGEPPKSFRFEGKEFTPLSFYEDMVKPCFNVNEYVSLVNAKGYQEMDRLLTIENLGYLCLFVSLKSFLFFHIFPSSVSVFSCSFLL